MIRKDAKHKERTACGVGSALMDIIVEENDQFLIDNEIVKGGMCLVDRDKITDITESIVTAPVSAPGGSACNTVVALGNLLGEAKFIGCRGDDNVGHFLEMSLRENNVQPSLYVTDEAETGRVISVVTPDAQRSMVTYLGASALTPPQFFTPSMFLSAYVVHFEAYLVFNEQLFAAALDAAKSAGSMISLDLSSFNLVKENLPLFEKFVRKYVDIVFANEDEVAAYGGIDKMVKDCPTVVAKYGKNGSHVFTGGSYCAIPPYGVGGVIDTTGAGDLYAGGFLYGIIKELPVEVCGYIGSVCGYEVCKVLGAHLPKQTWEDIKKVI